MKKIWVIVAALAIHISCEGAHAAPNPDPSSAIGGQVPLAVSNASTRVALPAPLTPYNALAISNVGQKDAYYAVGDVTCTATTAGIRVPAGTTITPVWAANSYVCAITANTDTTTLLIYQANGPVYLPAAPTTWLSGIYNAITAILGAASSPVTQLASTPTFALLQNATAANANGALLPVNGMATVAVTVNCAGCSGGTTVNFTGSEDGINYTPVTGSKIGTTTTGNSVTTSGLTYWQFNVTGLQFFRTPVSGYSAGVITVTGHALPQGGSSGGSSGGGGGGGGTTNLTPVAPGTATATQGTLGGGTYNATPQTATDGQQMGAQFDAHGSVPSLLVDGNRTPVDPTQAVGEFRADSYTYITTKTNTPLKGSAAVLTAFITGTLGSTDTITLKDTVNADCSGGVTIGVITSPPVGRIEFGAQTTNGLCIITGGTTAGDYTAIWR